MSDLLPPALRALVDKRFDFGGGTVADHDPVTIVATLWAVAEETNRSGVYLDAADLRDWADAIEREAQP